MSTLLRNFVDGTAGASFRRYRLAPTLVACIPTVLAVDAVNAVRVTTVTLRVS